MAVLVAIILAVVIIPLAAIVIDLGYARDLRAQAQTAADAAALAAGVTYTAADGGDYDAAKGVAQEYVRQNFPADYTAFVACGDACVTIDPTAKSVTVRLPAVSSPQAFAAGSTAVSAHATASWKPMHPCVLCVGSVVTVGQTFFGSSYPGSIAVSGGGMAVNGDVTSAGSSGTVTVADGEEALHTGDWSSAVAGANRKVPAVTLPDSTTVSTQLDTLMTAQTIGPLDPVPTALPAVRCSPAAGTVLAYVEARTLAYCSGFAPGIYFVVPTCTVNAFGAVNCSTAAKFLAGATVSGRSADGVSGALFVPACRSLLDPKPIPCDGFGSTSPAAALTGPSVSGAPASLTSLQGYTAVPALNGLAIAGDTLATTPQALTNLTVDGNVYLDTVTVGLTTVSGRMVVRVLTTGRVRTPSLTIGVLTAEEAVGPIRLVP